MIKILEMKHLIGRVVLSHSYGGLSLSHCVYIMRMEAERAARALAVVLTSRV